MKAMKRMLAMLLALVLMVSMVPVQAAAAESNQITLVVVDTAGRPITNVPVVLHNRTQTIDYNGTTDSSGSAVFTISDNLNVGDLFDCDPGQNSGYSWDFSIPGKQDKVRELVSANGVNRTGGSNDEGCWDNAQVAENASEPISFTFRCVMTSDTKHTVTWKNGDDTLHTDTVVLGVKLNYTGAQPEKADTNTHTYEFIGWSENNETPVINPAVIVNRDITYNAQFEAITRKYKVTWVVNDATKENAWEYNQTPSYDENDSTVAPSAYSDNGYDYSFTGWDSEVVPVTGEATYTAQFSRTCIHQKDDQGYCAAEDCSHDRDCTCNPATHIITLKVQDKAGNALSGVSVDLKLTRNSSRGILITSNPTDSDGTTVLKLAADALQDGDILDCDSADTTKFDWDWTVKGQKVRTLQAVSGVQEDGGSNDDGAWDNAVVDGSPVKFTFILVMEDKTPAQPDPVTYTVYWKNEDGTELCDPQTTTDPTGDHEYPGETKPTKEPTLTETFEFNGTWTKDVDHKNKTVTYTAQYTPAERKYTIKWIVGDDETEQTLAYGAPIVPPTDLTLTGYKFMGWTPTPAATVTGDADYTADFDAVHTVTLNVVDKDNKPLSGVEMILYKRNADNSGRTQIGKDSTENGVVVFENLTLSDNDILDCDPANRDDYDWTAGVLVRELTGKTDNVDLVDRTGEAVKCQDAQIKDADIPGAVTFTCRLIKKVPTYTITWKNEDGTELGTTTVDQGATPVYDGEAPTKDADAQNTYRFDGVWKPQIVPATENATYTAEYTAIPKQYTITWIVGDMETETTWAYGATPSYGTDAPTKADSGGYRYEFKGWDPAVVNVTGDAEYTAQFSKECLHEKNFFGICKEKPCSHPEDCDCNPDVTEGARSVSIITKDGTWNRMGNVPVVLMMNPNVEGQAHVKLWEGTTDENGDVAVPAAVLEDVLPGSSLYACVNTESGKFDWAYEIGQEVVRTVSGGEKLVNAGISKDSDDNEYAWITAEEGDGFQVEFTLFVKSKEAPSNPDPDAPAAPAVPATIRLKVYDLNNKTLPISGLSMVLNAKNGTANNGQTPDEHGRVRLGAVTTDVNGEAVFRIEDINDFDYTFLNGTVIDCDIDSENYFWDPSLATTGGSRYLMDAQGVVRDSNPNHCAQVTEEGAAEGFTFTFVCYVDSRDLTYTVKFSANGGSGTMANQIIPCNANTALNANTYTKTGHSFAGWTVGNSNVFLGNQEIVRNLAAAGTEVTLVAKWTANNYTIVLDPNGGSVTPGTMSVTYGQAIGTMPTPVRSGYTFKGWYTSQLGGTQITSGMIYGTPNNDTYYARWERNTTPVQPGPSHNSHDYKTAYNETYHWQECSCGSTYGKDTHNYGSWLISQKASEYSTGVKYRVCADCGYTQWKEIPRAFNPNTGDYIMIAVAVMVIAAGGLAGAFFYSKKKKQY